MPHVAENLDWVVRYFAADPVGSMATLEDTYRSDRHAFIAQSLVLLNESAENPGLISLVSFLVKKQELLALLCQPEIPLANRVRQARLALRVDANLDRTIADRLLAKFSPAAPDEVRQDLLEILSQTRVRPEVVAALAPLLADPHPRVHSKMAFLMARVEPEGLWVSEGLADPDPRVRANIIEALWNQKGNFANAIFHRASTDAHHRVAANAIYGLYLQGDPAALSSIRHLILNSSGLHLRAGLWLTERTRDPRYLALLGKLIGKVEPAARARCLKVIQAAKSRKQQAIQRGQIKLDWFAATPGQARLTATLGGRRLTNLHPFDIILQANGQVVDDYHLKALPPADRRVVLLIGDCPETWRDAIPASEPSSGLTSAPASSPVDRFGFLRYQPEPEIEISAPSAASPVAFRLLGVDVASNLPVKLAEVPSSAADEAAPTAVAQGITWCGPAPGSLRRAFEKVQLGTNSLGAAIRLAASQMGTSSAATHFVVLDPAGSFQEADVIEDVPAANFELHVLTTQTDHRLAGRLAGRCDARGGRLQIVSSPEDAARYLATLNRSWHADYEVIIATGTAVNTVELFSESGYGIYSAENAKDKGNDTKKSGMVGAQGLEPRASSV